MADFVERFSKVPLAQKVLLLLLMMGTVFFCFLILGYSPLEAEILAQQSRAQALESQDAQASRLQQDVSDRRDTLSREQQRRADNAVELPVRADTFELFEELGAIADEVPTSPMGTSLLIEDNRQRPRIPGANYTRIPLTYRVTATYDQLVDFSWRVASMNRIVHIKSVNVRMVDPASRTLPGPPLLRATIELEAFFNPGG